MTNCQDFDDLSIKRLPKTLDSIQTYGRELHGQGLQGHQQYQLFMKCYESGMSHLLLLLCSMSHWVSW